MGMLRDSGDLQVDLIKEMAEGLGSQGIRIEEILIRIRELRSRLRARIEVDVHGEIGSVSSEPALVDDIIGEYNLLVARAEEALRWLLIQREACGFRTHRHVSSHYPIPCRIRFPNR